VSSDADELEEYVQHLFECLVEPGLIAAALQSRGYQVAVRGVFTNLKADGFLVTCCDCGRQARMGSDPGGKAVLCPPCLKKAILGRQIAEAPQGEDDGGRNVR
jgi:hypothetical protein